MVSPSPTDILQLGHPLLRAVAQPVELPLQPDTLNLIEQLMMVMERDAGVGIAAPQIGRSLQVVIVASRPTLRYPNAPSMAPLAMINPAITHYSETTTLGWEGCLSVPDLRGKVERSDSVCVQYVDRQGQPQHTQYHGFIARIIQHECDHLMGKVFLDRIQSDQQLMKEEEYFQIMP